MKTIATYFLCGFCVMFLIGVWQGWEERRDTTNEELQTLTAIENLTTAREASQSEDPTLSYVCGSTTFFTYNLSTDEQRELQHPVVESSLLSYSHIESVFEAATGIKLFNIVREGSSAESARELAQPKWAALAVGSLSGYFAGRAVAARSRPGCDSPLLLAKMRDKNSPLAMRARREYFRMWLAALSLDVDGVHHQLLGKGSNLRDLLYSQFDIRKPPEEPGRELSFVLFTEFRTLELIWNKFSNTSYNPTGKDCLDLASTSDFVFKFLEIHSEILKQAYPNAKTIKPEFFLTDYGTVKQMAPIAASKASFWSANLMLLTVSGCFIVLAILGLGVLIERSNRNRKLPNYGFAPESPAAKKTKHNSQ